MGSSIPLELATDFKTNILRLFLCVLRLWQLSDGVVVLVSKSLKQMGEMREALACGLIAHIIRMNHRYAYTDMLQYSLETSNDSRIQYIFQSPRSVRACAVF